MLQPYSQGHKALDDGAETFAIKCGSGAGGVVGDFELDNDPDLPGLSPNQMERLRDTVARAVAAQAGSHPGGLERWAHARLQPSAPWPVVLRAAVQRSLPKGIGHHRHSWSRPRRHNPTDALLPSLRGAPIHMAVIIDSSGSMSQAHLDQAVSDITVLRRIPGVDRLTLISCDVDAVEVSLPRRGSPIALIGGGGTSLTSGLEFVRGLRPRADLVVVITDGLTDWPAEAPPLIAPVVTLVPEGGPGGPDWMTTLYRPVPASTKAGSAL